MKFDRFDAADCSRHKLRVLGFAKIVYRQHVFPLKLNLHLPRFDKPGHNPEKEARTGVRCAQGTRCILERFIVETSVVVESQRKTANVQHQLGQRGPRFNMFRGVKQGWRMGAL